MKSSLETSKNGSSRQHHARRWRRFEDLSTVSISIPNQSYHQDERSWQLEKQVSLDLATGSDRGIANEGSAGADFQNLITPRYVPHTQSDNFREIFTARVPGVT